MPGRQVTARGRRANVCSRLDSMSRARSTRPRVLSAGLCAAPWRWARGGTAAGARARPPTLSEQSIGRRGGPGRDRAARAIDRAARAALAYREQQPPAGRHAACQSRPAAARGDAARAGATGEDAIQPNQVEPRDASVAPHNAGTYSSAHHRACPEYVGRRAIGNGTAEGSWVRATASAGHGPG